MPSIFKRFFIQGERNIIIVLFTLLYAYLWIRAIRVPVFHDEAATFYHYIQTGQFLPYFSNWDANNHFLNSALTWVSYSVFGLSTWALRLPNLLIAPLLFFAVYKIGKEIPDKWIRIVWIVTVCFTHFFIEYSAMARGYGMSMAFIIAAIWFTIRVAKYNKTASYIGAALMSMLALLSNLILIYSVLILMVLLLVIAIIQNHENIKGFFRRVGLLTLFGIIPALWVISYLFELKSREMLYYGIEGNFWQVTVQTLVYNSINGTSEIATVFAAFMFVLILMAFIISVSKAKRLCNILTSEFIFYYLLLGNIFLFVLQHYLLGLKYPEDRIGLFLIPLFLGSFYFALSRLVTNFNSVYIKYLAIPLLYLPVSFLLSANFTHFTYWETMGVSERFYKHIASATPKNSMPPVVGGQQIKRPLFWAFYNYLDGGRQNLLHRTDTTETTDDYLIFNVNDHSAWKDLYTIIDYDKLRDVHLLQRKTKAPRQLLRVVSNVTTADTINQTYFSFLTGSLDSLTGRDIFFSWDLTFFSPDEPFRGVIVLDFSDQNKNSIYYHTYKLFRQRKSWDGTPHNAVNGIKHSGIPANAKYFSFYLWNIQGQKFFISEGEVRVTEFVKH